jgi:hypothetical protein
MGVLHCCEAAGERLSCAPTVCADGFDGELENATDFVERQVFEVVQRDHLGLPFGESPNLSPHFGGLWAQLRKEFIRPHELGERLGFDDASTDH